MGSIRLEIETKEAKAKEEGELTLEIDDKEVKAKEGMTILEAAHSVGIDIPTLCYDERLTPYGACRLCVVEIFKEQRSRLVTSCNYPVEDGLVVKTESTRVFRLRKRVLELMLARAPCLEFEEGLARRYGIEKTPFVAEPTFCILCGLCVRYCAEVKKVGALGFVGRGTQRQVVIYPHIAAEVCPDCRECFSICPTGVIPSDYAIKVPRFGKLPLVLPVKLRG